MDIPAFGDRPGHPMGHRGLAFPPALHRAQAEGPALGLLERAWQAEAPNIRLNPLNNPRRDRVRFPGARYISLPGDRERGCRAIAARLSFTGDTGVQGARWRIAWDFRFWFPAW